jgi:hypothetical protein
MSTQPSYESRRDVQDISGGAAGGIIFAATMLVVIGTFHVISAGWALTRPGALRT